MTEPEEVSTCLTGSEGLVLSNHSKTAQRKTTKRNVEEHGKCFRGQILKKKKKDPIRYGHDMVNSEKYMTFRLVDRINIWSHTELR